LGFRFHQASDVMRPSARSSVALSAIAFPKIVGHTAESARKTIAPVENLGRS
jgi:hypothetical protein